MASVSNGQSNCDNLPPASNWNSQESEWWIWQFNITVFDSSHVLISQLKRKPAKKCIKMLSKRCQNFTTNFLKSRGNGMINSTVKLYPNSGQLWILRVWPCRDSWFTINKIQILKRSLLILCEIIAQDSFHHITKKNTVSNRMFSRRLATVSSTFLSYSLKDEYYHCLTSDATCTIMVSHKCLIIGKTSCGHRFYIAGYHRDNTIC